MSQALAAASGFVRSPGFKFFLISFLILLLLVPLLMVLGLVSEREGRANSVAYDVAKTWGGQQQLSGPFLVVPYMIKTQMRDGDKLIDQLIERRAVFLPEELKISANAASKVLHRSIFDINVYTASLAVDGRFSAPDLSEVDANAVSIRWRDATIVLALSDVAGLKEAATVAINGSETIAFAPSMAIPGSSMNGIHAKLAGAPSVVKGEEAVKPFTFHADLIFSGSGTLTYAPAARETNVKLESDWPHPSFTGAFLPVDRSISETGFSASWRVPHLARSVPNAWSLSETGIERFNPYQFGVSFYSPIDFYDAVNRAVKYGILFLGAAFMVVFMLELLSGRSVHPVQYLFVGTAMIFFYVLLLSLAEHTGFLIAYVTAALATGGMLSLYVGKVLKSARSGIAMLLMFLLLYSFLYLILQLEDYALLAGAILGFALLTAVMFITLRVDWTGLSSREAN